MCYTRKYPSILVLVQIGGRRRQESLGAHAQGVGPTAHASPALAAKNEAVRAKTLCEETLTSARESSLATLLRQLMALESLCFGNLLLVITLPLPLCLRLRLACSLARSALFCATCGACFFSCLFCASCGTLCLCLPES